MVQIMDENLGMRNSDELNKLEFVVPDRILQDDNGDICVIDRIGINLKFTYPSEPTEGDAMTTARRISLSDVFVADENNNYVIVLTSNCEEITRFSKILRKNTYSIVAPNRIV